MISNDFYPYYKPGFLEVYCGPMKSGKTKRIINRIDRLRFVNGCNFIFIKPRLDNRNEKITSRFSDMSVDCFIVDENNPCEIFNHVSEDVHIVFIDETQFFNKDIIEIILKLLDNDIHVIVSGLDQDFRAIPFGPIPDILALANKVHKLTGICEYDGCNQPATRSQRLINGKPARFDDPLVSIEGFENSYECRCIKHHFVPKD